MRKNDLGLRFVGCPRFFLLITATPKLVFEYWHLDLKTSKYGNLGLHHI